MKTRGYRLSDNGSQVFFQLGKDDFNNNAPERIKALRTGAHYTGNDKNEWVVPTRNWYRIKEILEPFDMGPFEWEPDYFIPVNDTTSLYNSADIEDWEKLYVIPGTPLDIVNHVYQYLLQHEEDQDKLVKISQAFTRIAKDGGGNEREY